MEPSSRPRKTALVTGASRGIGLELARLLAADEFDLVLVGRDSAALERLAGEFREWGRVAVRVEARDLSERGAPAQLWADLTAAGVRVDILVNNAGSGLYGKVEELDPEALERMIQLNIVALVSLTRLALPGMRERGWGRILNVGSIVGYQPAGPRMAGYYASKAFVASFTKALASELAGTGVSATLLSPGPTESSFEERSGASGTNLYKYVPKMTAASVARAGYEGLMRGALSVIPGLVSKLLAFAGELPPRAAALAVNRFLLRRVS